MSRKALLMMSVAAGSVLVAVLATVFWLRQVDQVSEQGPTDWHDFKTWPKEYRRNGKLLRLKLRMYGNDYMGELRSLDELRPDEGWVARYVYLDSQGREVFGGTECAWSPTGALTCKVWKAEGGLYEEHYYPTGEPIRRIRVAGGPVETEQCFDRQGNVLGSITPPEHPDGNPIYRWAGQVVTKKTYHERREALRQMLERAWARQRNPGTKRTPSAD